MQEEDSSPKPTDLEPNPNPNPNPEEDSLSDSDPATENSDSDSDSDSDSETDTNKPYFVRPGEPDDDDPPEEDNSPEANVKRFMNILQSRSIRKEQAEEEKEYVFHEDLFDFPKDPENWKEEDLKELWADAPVEMTKPGWDPNWVDDDEVEIINNEIKAGRDPAHCPVVIEELDRIEEFLQWASYIFADGSSYEGTVWDDLAHGRGVHVAEQGLVRYEGQWFQNNPEGHGVIEVDIPDYESVPGSKLEAKMRAEGKIISRDFMSPEDREWVEMDIEDSIRLAGGKSEIPFYENEEWVRQFGKEP